MTLEELGQELQANAAEIVEGAEELATTEPWISLPEELRLNHLVPLVRTMVSRGFGGVGGRVTVRELVEAAAEHGRQRGEQGFSDETILLEYQILREAVERFLREGHFSEDALLEGLVRMDAEITTATSGSLLGVHRASMDEETAASAFADLVARREGVVRGED